MNTKNIPFNAPFQDQLDFFKAKLNVPTARWDDLVRGGHDVGFMVAGAQQADMLASFREAITKAIEQGTSLQEFRADFDKIVTATGWDYNGGRDWRTRVIYETNVRTSYSAGRYAQLSDKATLAARPFWFYSHSDDVLDPRLEHLAWHGVILDAKDPWWDTHYPPNGWGCRCTVFAIAADELPDYGKTKVDLAPTAVEDMAGIDKNWDYAPGQLASQMATMAETKVSSLMGRDEALARLYVERLLDNGSFDAWFGRLETVVEGHRAELDAVRTNDAVDFLRGLKFINRNGNWPIAILDVKAKELLNTEAKIVNFSTETAAKQIYAHSDLTAQSYRLLQQIFDNPFEVIKEGDFENVYFSDSSGQIYKAVLKATLSRDTIFLQSLIKANTKELERVRRRQNK